MYLYVQALSYVASVLIMVAVCVERYVAIMQPFQTRSVFTTARLRVSEFFTFLSALHGGFAAISFGIALLILFTSLALREIRWSR
jgi:hypothetical protein